MIALCGADQIAVTQEHAQELKVSIPSPSPAAVLTSTSADHRLLHHQQQVQQYVSQTEGDMSSEQHSPAETDSNTLRIYYALDESVRLSLAVFTQCQDADNVPDDKDASQRG